MIRDVLTVLVLLAALLFVADRAWHRWQTRPFYVTAHLRPWMTGDENARELNRAVHTPSPDPRRNVVVVLPPGTFSVEGTTALPQGVSLRGAGR